MGFARFGEVLHGLFWGPRHGEFAMPVGDDQPRGRVRVEMLKVGVFGQHTPSGRPGAPWSACEGLGGVPGRRDEY